MKHLLYLDETGEIDDERRNPNYKLASCYGPECQRCNAWWCIPHEGPWVNAPWLMDDCTEVRF